MGLKQLCETLVLLGSADIGQLSQLLNIPVNRTEIWLAQLERMGKVESLGVIPSSGGCVTKSPYCPNCTQSGCNQTEGKQEQQLANDVNNRRYKLV